MRNSGVFNLFFSEAIFEHFAHELADEAERQPETNLDETIARYRQQVRACVYFIFAGIGALCFYSDTWVAVAALAWLLVFGIDLPWLVRAVLLLRRAKDIQSLRNSASLPAA